MKEFIEKLIGRLEEQIKIEESIAKSKTEGYPITHQYASNCLKLFRNQVNQLAEEHNNGWIACSERLPEENGTRYLVQKTNGFIDILCFTTDAYKVSRYDFAEYKGKKKHLFYDYDSEYGYIEWECEAWQPLPTPYQPKGE